jgi:hypothetical protein
MLTVFALTGCVGEGTVCKRRILSNRAKVHHGALSAVPTGGTCGQE